MNKYFITANELLADSFKLAEKILASGYQPDLVVGVWRGGTPVAIAIHEYLQYKGLKADHIAIRAASYTGIDQQEEQVRIDELEYIVENTGANSSVLLVDDVFDSGRSVKAIKECLAEMMQSGLPELRVAAPWFKPYRNVTDLTPDYYLHKTDDWLVFPHELCGLTEEEIGAKFQIG